MTAATLSPEQATTNLSAWANILGLEKAPDFLTAQSADGWGIGVGALLFIVGAISIALNRRQKTLSEKTINEELSLNQTRVKPEFKNTELPLSEDHAMTKKHITTGFKVRGNGNMLGNNLSVGLDIGYDVDGEGNELYGNRAMTHEQFSEYLSRSTFTQSANINNDPVAETLISKLTIELKNLGISSEKFEAIKKEIDILHTQLSSLKPSKKHMNYSLAQIKRPLNNITKHHELDKALLDILRLIDKKGV